MRAMFCGMQGEMQSNSFFSGYYYSTGNVNSEASLSFWPVKDIDMILTNGYNMNGAFSFSYWDLYLRHSKEVLKQTMLKHESVFEDQIHELHRLYQRQKELMVEMESSYANPSFSQSSSQHSPSKSLTTSTLWLNNCISTSKQSTLPQEDTSATVPEFSANEGEKSRKVLLDLELPACEYLDIGEERALQQGKVREVPSLLRETSTRSITHMSDFQRDDLHHSTCSSKLKCMLDLNEPVKIEETLDSELNNFLDTSSVILEESPTTNDMESAENGPQETNEVQVPPPSEKCQRENGIDLNMSPPLCEDKLIVQENIESEQTQEALSVSLYGKHRLRQSSVVVQALPCLNGIVSSRKYSKSLTRSTWPSKKVICGAIETDLGSFLQSKACQESDVDLNSGVHADDDPFLAPASSVPEMDLQAPVSPENKESARPSTGSNNNQMFAEKDNPSSLVDVDSLQKQINLNNKDGGSRDDLENRGSLLVTEEEEQERIAAEAIVDISSSSLQALQDISANVTCGNLHWFAKIASLVVEDISKAGLSKSNNPSSNGIDYFEAMTLQLTEMNIDEHYNLPKTNVSNHKTAVSNLYTGRLRRGPGRRGKRQPKDFQNEVLQSLASLSRNEVSEDLQTIGGLVEVNGTKWENRCTRSKAKNGVSPRGRRQLFSTPSKAIDWGTISRRRRGPRSPAANFQHILSQV